MSDTSQGEGWWIASDGKWYAPESATHLPPPPPPSAPGLESTTPPLIAQNVPLPPEAASSVADIPAPTAPESDRPIYKRPAVVIPIAAIVILAVVVAVVLLGNNKKSNTNSAGTQSASGFQPTTTTTDPTAAAAAAYISAYNAMVNAENPEITAENADGNNSAALTADINNRIATRQTFDTAMQSITFPSSAQSDAQQVTAADAALETALNQLAANTDDTTNYNSVFATVSTAETQFSAADATLSSDLGVTTNSAG
jgi:hypothetical protein